MRLEPKRGHHPELAATPSQGPEEIRVFLLARGDYSTVGEDDPRRGYSAFYNTDLETVVRCLRVEDVVVSGIMTNMCCESTARDAYYRDYRVFFLADGTGSISEEMHLASLLNLAFGFAYVTTSDAIVAQLATRASPNNGM